MESSPWIAQGDQVKAPLSRSIHLNQQNLSDQATVFRADKSIKKYPAKEHASRVAEALGCTTGAVFLPGRPSKYFQDSDMGPEFRQWRYFYYLTGVDEPDCNMVYDIEADQVILYVPDTKSFHDIVWGGAGLTQEDALARYDIDAADYYSELNGLLRKYLKSKKGPLFILHPNDLKSFELPASDLINHLKLMPAMNSCRVIKDKYEIEAIREANRISALAHTDVLRSISTLKNETNVEAIFKGVCIDQGAKHQAYNPIAASGTNAATLHYMKNDEPLKGRQLMCLDAGCEWTNYACDVTRTFPLSKSWPSQEAKEIYDIVELMQESCISLMRPGVLYRDLSVLAMHTAVEGLLKLGILHNGTVADIVKAGTCLAFFPHGLGHHVGLEVHDVAPENDPLYSSTVWRPFGLYGGADSLLENEPYGKRPFLTNAMFDPRKETEYFKKHYGHLIQPGNCHAPVDLASGALRPGMVVTVEPGIYFNEFALENFYLPSPIHSKYINKPVLERYMSVGGVRIEDDILIRDGADGPENLTTAPKGDDMLKIIREGPKEKELLRSASYSGELANRHSSPVDVTESIEHLRSNLVRVRQQLRVAYI